MKSNRLLILLVAVFFAQVAVESWAKDPTHESRTTIPLSGRALQFSDPYGPFSFKEEVIHYKSKDGATIEATLLHPETEVAKPGLVFVHMWARDRNTYWGLPQYLASYGYPSIFMDLRGHGNSNPPNSKYRYTINDKRKSYSRLYLDVIPGIDILNKQPSVKTNHLILIGASLGCPTGVLAAAERKHLFIGMVHLSPAIIYFDVNCRKALESMRDVPNHVILENTDASFNSGVRFFEISGLYKVLYQVDKTGHGTNMLFHDLGIPTIILAWVQQLDTLNQTLRRVQNSPMLVPIK